MIKKIILYSFCAVLFLGLIAFGIVQTNQLNDIQATLTTTQNELTNTQSEVSNTNIELTDTQNEIQVVSNTLEDMMSQLQNTKADYKKTSTALAAEKKLVLMLQSGADNLQMNISFLTTGYGYIMQDPTYQECKIFMATDTTDLKPYVVGSYVCEDFSFDVKNHAIQQKIRCAYVVIEFAPNASGHAIIAFNTTDRGIVYFEPQSDEEVNLQIGKHYWTQCVKPSSGYYYSNPTDYDDTVEGFDVIW